MKLIEVVRYEDSTKTVPVRSLKNLEIWAPSLEFYKDGLVTFVINTETMRTSARTRSACKLV
jgi:hypothetical protein